MSSEVTFNGGKPRVCVCVMMNHPFPANLPILRKIYEGRFSEVRFLIPFERLPDEDVFTVYRGSYVHAAYITDAYEKLAAIDCDYYLVVHDDVLLNPAISEENFLEYFGLGPNDGFIPVTEVLSMNMGSWAWNFAFIPRLLFPKSMIMGSGVEYANLVKYLPSRERLSQALVSNSRDAGTRFAMDASNLVELDKAPAKVVLNGLSASPASDPVLQEALDRASVDIGGRLVDLMRDAANGQWAQEEIDNLGLAVDLPIPFLMSGHFGDLYILPKSGLADFAHFMGVAGAANLFVEIMAPTLLHVCCDRVRTADQLGLDTSGFDEIKSVSWLKNPKSLAIHPIKLSSFRGSGADTLTSLLTSLRDGTPLPTASLSDEEGQLPLSMHIGSGWNGLEPWGVWAAESEAVIEAPTNSPTSLRIFLRAPVPPEGTPMRGRLVYRDAAGSHALPFEKAWPAEDFDFLISGVLPDDDGVVRVRLVCETLFEPAKLGGHDFRKLGFGLLKVIRVAL